MRIRDRTYLEVIGAIRGVLPLRIRDETLRAVTPGGGLRLLIRNETFRAAASRLCPGLRLLFKEKPLFQRSGICFHTDQLT